MLKETSKRLDRLSDFNESTKLANVNQISYQRYDIENRLK